MWKLAKYCAHSVIAMAVCTIAGLGLLSLISRTALSSVTYYSLDDTILLFVVPAAVTFAIGFALQKLIDDQSARWVWIVGTAWFVFAATQIARDPLLSSRVVDEPCSAMAKVFDSLFAPTAERCQTGEGFDVFMVTLPMMNSIVYSLAALLVQKMPAIDGAKTGDPEDLISLKHK